MIFSSYYFIFIFLPLVVIGYQILQWCGLVKTAKFHLVASSLIFYCLWKIDFLPIFLGSIFVNYALGSWIPKIEDRQRRFWTMMLGIFGNLALLFYYKYMAFVLGEFNHFFGTGFRIERLILPLGISFFSFQQISYLMDAYAGKRLKQTFLDYCLFVAFFPQLIAGPIVFQSELLPQFLKMGERRPNSVNYAKGMFLFSIGLFKKVMIADMLAHTVAIAFDRESDPNILRSWAACVGFTFQLYFDFSGYMDMALGIATMLNIELPVNFRSPLRASNISDFWQRWHITMTRFFMTTIYNPLAMKGMRLTMSKGFGPTLTFLFTLAIPIFLTFLVAGVWHGAGWNFLLFGVAHGLALIVHRLWQKTGFSMPTWLGRIMCFSYFAASLVLFRAVDFASAIKVFRGMGGAFANSSNGPAELYLNLFFIGLASLVALYPRNSQDMVKDFKPTLARAAFVILLVAVSISNIAKQAEFLYWQF